VTPTPPTLANGLNSNFVAKFYQLSIEFRGIQDALIPYENNADGTPLLGVCHSLQNDLLSLERATVPPDFATNATGQGASTGPADQLREVEDWVALGASDCIAGLNSSDPGETAYAIQVFNDANPVIGDLNAQMP
jgi:hypothetical protein